MVSSWTGWTSGRQSCGGRHGGSGPPILLLHGHSRTHATWHAVWRGWADDLRGRSLDCGHHLAEEVPEELAAELRAFLPD
jgi:pimeloyl-ACP methyl ester carboxylesterase